MTYMLRMLVTPIKYIRLYNAGINGNSWGIKYNEPNSKTTTNIHPHHIIFDACTRKQVSEP